MLSTDDITLRVSGTVQDSIVDGPGLRFVVFAQGCPHRCEGCHNTHTHDPGAGRLETVGGLWAELKSNPLTMGLTLSGGEPFSQPRPLAALAQLARDAGLSVWTYTGYLFEALLAMPDCMPLLKNTDVLVDGPFILSQKTHKLLWRGSANQRLIDVKASLNQGSLALYSEE